MSNLRVQRHLCAGALGSKPTEVQRAFTEELETAAPGDSSIEEATDNMVSKINAIQAEE